MNWRWLLYDNTDPQWELTPRERGAVMRRVEKILKTHRGYRGPRRVMFIVGVVALYLIVSGIMSMIGGVKDGGLFSNECMIGIIVFLFAMVISQTLMAVAWRFVSIDITRQAACELGYLVCRECGYWLKGLDVSTDRCPECGEEIRKGNPA